MLEAMQVNARLMFINCANAVFSYLATCMNIQGCLEKLRGPGQRIKVGPQVSILSHNFTQAVSQRLKKEKKDHHMLIMTTATPR